MLVSGGGWVGGGDVPVSSWAAVRSTWSSRFTVDIEVCELEGYGRGEGHAIQISPCWDSSSRGDVLRESGYAVRWEWHGSRTMNSTVEDIPDYSCSSTSSTCVVE